MPAATSSPLSSEQLAAVELANRRAAPLRSAERVATWDIWMLAAAAVFSLVFAALDPGALLAAVVLAGAAAIEHRGRRQLEALEESGVRLLALNQLGLMVLLILYSLVGIAELLSAGSGQALLAAEPSLQAALDHDPTARAALGGAADWARDLALLVYAALACAALLVQGGLAYFYWSRARRLRELLSETEPWILELLQRSRSGMG